METIIYTNSKREASNYIVDKICFADRVDIGQVIEQEMNRYNIRHLNLWFISSNIIHLPGISPTKLLLNMAKYLSENKEMSFDFQYLVEKYQELQLLGKRTISDLESQNKNSQKMSIFNITRKESAGLYDQKGTDSDNHSTMNKQTLNKEEILREQISYTNAQDLQNFLQKDHNNRVDSDIVKNYIFRTKTETIKLSFIEPHKRQFLKKIIDFANDQIYDAKLNLKKKFTCLFQDHSSIKYHKLFPAAHTFHNKLILFLFQSERSGEQVGRKQKMKSNFKPNYSLQALEDWRIKDENVNVAIKLERQCELIKQEIESERIAFRNKIKTLENFIGQAINVEKLLQEEDDDQKSKFLPAQTSSNSFKKAEKHKKMSFSQTASKNAFVTTQTTTSEFKRLKDIADAMRNIDNTLAEQNRKIQAGKTKIKESVKSKQSLLYANARELNKLKAEILQLESQIRRKELEIEERMKKGDFLEIAMLKDKKPTSKARLRLEEHKQFMNGLKGAQGTEKTIGQAHQRHNNSKQTKRKHEDRTTHRSHHIPRNHSNVDTISLLLRYKEKKIKEAVDSQVQAFKVKEQEKLRKTTLRKPFGHTSQSCKEENCFTMSQNQSQDEITVNLLTKQLLQLYHYYSKNRTLMSKMKKEIQSYKLIQHSRPFIISDSQNTSKSQMRCNKAEQFSINSLDTFNELNFCEFPILSQVASSTMKHVSDNNSKSTNQLNRTFKQQYKYNSNYFDIMIEKQNKLVPPVGSAEAQPSDTTQLLDKVIEADSKEVPEIKITPATKYKSKRITIEQAINFNYKQLRFSKIN